MPVKSRTCQWCLAVCANLDQLVDHIKALHMEALDPPRYKPLPVAPPDAEDDKMEWGQEGDW